MSLTKQTVMTFNPDTSVANELRQRLDGKDPCSAKNLALRNHNVVSAKPINAETAASTRPVKSIEHRNLKTLDWLDRFTSKPFSSIKFAAKVTIGKIVPTNCVYRACPTGSCGKKLLDPNDGTFKCEKCRQTFRSFKWMLKIKVTKFAECTFLYRSI